MNDSEEFDLNMRSMLEAMPAIDQFYMIQEVCAIRSQTRYSTKEWKTMVPDAQAICHQNSSSAILFIMRLHLTLLPLCF